MPQIKAPRLYKNRCGVFYFRIKSKDEDRRVSLRTKCPVTANIIALRLNADLERERTMSKPKISDFSFLPENVRKSYEFDIKAGTVRGDSEQDHRNGMGGGAEQDAGNPSSVRISANINATASCSNSRGSKCVGSC
jgi:hypothetical protein